MPSPAFTGANTRLMPCRLCRLALPAIAAGVAVASPALGHAILIDSTPAPLAHVAPGHINMVFRYNSRIDAGRSKLTLKRADDSTERLTTEAAQTPDVLKAGIDLAPGDYVISWQVLATDGHITRGNVRFTVDPAPAPKASAQAVK
jgi:methionine-rich copper-binding protein CopC